MKLSLITLLLILTFCACETKSGDIKFCQDCDLKTDGIQVIENKDGWIVFLSEFDRYAIEVAHYNDPIVYLPCQIPSYFEPTEMETVEFSGTIIEDPCIKGEDIETTYYCIRLDTIFSVNKK